MFIYWVARLLRDVVLFSFVNRSYAVGTFVVALLLLGLLVAGAEVSAPFIYTLF